MLNGVHSFTSKELYDVASASETTDTSLLSTISLICFIVAGVLLAAAVFLFFYLRITKVISDLSGRTAKKSIQSLRYRNEQTGSKSYRSSKTNKERGKITDAIPKKAEKTSKDITETGVLKEEKTEKLSEETEELSTHSEKAAMEAMRYGEQNATGVLQQTNETTMLPPIDEAAKKAKDAMNWKILEEVILIHTDEVIPWQS